ncbi:hypothetical protein GE061_012821 [Apolygus lucorum]|uniref:Uncharacterized protein n=1 Tax=Apolygus lucorum TaxID=248454 RepID=A0A6A4K345_APOLU|nr:hypothetical protein GE061_012821 [Apolygus lucorum]
MYSQVAVLLGLVCTSLAFPRTYQEQRQIYYQQPLPVPYGAYQLPQQLQQQQQQPSIFQVPASTSFLPNNVPGLRYGTQQIVYVVPGGNQLLFEEGTTGGQGNSPYLESFMNFLNGHLPSRPGAQAPEKPVEKPAEEKPAENSVNASQEQEASPEEVTPPVEVLKPQAESGPAQLQQLPVQQPIQLAPLPPQHAAQLPTPQDHQLLQQQLLQQRYYQPYLLNQPQQLNQALYGRPAIAAPTANYLLNYRAYPLSDKKPGSSAIAFQKLLQKNAEAAAAGSSNNTAEGESGENDSSSSEEIGPSIAQAKPQAVSVAGPGGVAAAAPVGTAIVGPGGMALSAPTATAVAGTKPKPSDKTKSGYLRTNLYPF